MLSKSGCVEFGSFEKVALIGLGNNDHEFVLENESSPMIPNEFAWAW